MGAAMGPRFAPEYDESAWILKALREAAHELESQIWGLGERDLCRRPSEDGMCLKEIAAHLRDCEEHFGDCIERIARTDGARLRRFDGDALVLERDYRSTDIEDTLGSYESLRHRSVSLLWSLEPNDWSRTGEHPYKGTVSIHQLAREQNEHDLEHLWQARRLRETLEGAATR
jgi:DinB superfamily